MAADFNAPALEAYNFSNFALNVFGFEQIHFAAFDWDHAREVDLVYGKNGEVVAYAVKNFKRTVKAEIHAEAMEDLVRLAAPYGGNIEYLGPQPCVAKSEPNGRPSMILTYPQLLLTKHSGGFKKGESEVKIPLEFAVLQRPLFRFA